MKNAILFLELGKKIYKRLKSIDKSLENINYILEANSNINNIIQSTTQVTDSNDNDDENVILGFK